MGFFAIYGRRPMRLLYVEDEMTTAKAVQTLLRQVGYDLDLASNGEDAIEMAKANDYDLILLDIALPDMDGYEVIRQLRHTGVDTPFLFQTGLTDERLEENKGGSTPVDFVFKPFNRQQLISGIEKVMGTGPIEENTAWTERRGSQRLKALKSGRVVWPDTFDCIVLDVSDGGAAIRLINSEIEIPPNFSLAVRGTRDRKCELCWQVDDKAGVRFV